MFRPERKAQRASELAASVTKSTRVKRDPFIEFAINHGAREFRVMRPRTAIQIVRSDGRPHVVNNTDLGVDVYGVARFVLDVVDPDSVAASFSQDSESSRLGQSARRPRQFTVLIGVARNDADDLQLRLLT